MPPEIQRLGRTIKNWFDKICNFHLARVTNGPTESLNNLIKRIKCVFRRSCPVVPTLLNTGRDAVLVSAVP